MTEWKAARRERAGALASTTRGALRAPAGGRARAAARACAALTFACAVALAPPARAEGAIPGYRDSAAYLAEVVALDAFAIVQVEVIGRTPGGRKIHALVIGTGDVEKKPAIAVLGNVYAPQLVGAEIALGIARALAEGHAAGDARTLAALERATVYVIPRPSPDASERFFARPFHASALNERSTDDDRDGEAGEDPPSDLDGDGWITTIRVRDARGRFVEHPDDPRVLVEADPAKGERGAWRVLVEGRDLDGDESFGEDGPGGVDLNRNFTFRYPYFQPGAGPHQVSEPESRALADFLFGRRNVAVVLAIAPEDNLFHPWKPNPDKERERVKEHVLEADAGPLGRLAERYRELHGGKDAPPAARGEGSVVEWAYFHYGRFALGARAWWTPKVEAPSAASPTSTAPAGALPEPAPGAGPASPTSTSPAAPPGPPTAPAAGPDGAAPAAPPPPPPPAPASEPPAQAAGPQAPPDGGAPTSTPDTAAAAPPGDGTEPGATPKPAERKPDERAADLVNALRFFDREGIPGFAPWARIAHPDLPDREVEAGGVRPFFLLNPPVAKLSGLVDVHARFALELAEALPRLRLEGRRTALGGGVYRIEAAVFNEGRLPTATALGASGRLVEPLFAELALPAGARLLEGVARRRLEPIAGGGAFREVRWLVLAPEGAGAFAVRASSPTAGEAAIELP